MTILKSSYNFLRNLTASIVDGTSGTSFTQRKLTKFGYILEGFSANIFYDLIFIFNFTENIVIGGPFYNFPNGSTNSETLVQLNADIADISLLQVIHTSQRASEVTFLHPTYQIKIQAFFKTLDVKDHQNIITSPFDLGSWCVFASSWLILLLGIAIINFFTAVIFDLPISGKDKVFSKNSVLWAIAAASQNSWNPVPKLSSLKIIFLVGSVIGTIFLAAYSSQIISMMAVKLNPISNFSQLVSKDFIFTAHEKSGTVKTFLEDLINSSVVHQREVVEVYNYNEVSHFIENRKMAYLSPRDIFYYKASDNLHLSANYLCKYISTVDASYTFSGVGMFVKKGSNRRSILNFGLTMIIERGLNHRYRRQYDRKYALTCQNSRFESDNIKAAESTAISVEDLWTIYVINILGIASAVLAFLFEYALFYSKLTKTKI